MRAVRALLLLAAIASPIAHAQSSKWPERPVRVVVPYPPGGATDIVARMIALRLSDDLGQNFVVDNRAGAGGRLGTELVVQANPDGHTLLVMGSGYAANAALYQLSYDPVKGLSPIGTMTTSPLIFALTPSVKATNLKEFIALARAKPGTLNLGTAGTGSFGHLTGELFRQMAKIEIVHVPYKGDGPAIVDLLAGQVHFLFASGPALIPHFKTKRLRPLGVTTETRSPVLPDVPSISEVVPGYSVRTWFGMWAPARTPEAIVSKLNQALARVLKLAEVQERLRTDGMEPSHSAPQEFERDIAHEIAKWSKVVKAGNISVNQ
jgi:tripartite-type tricarboxylate transporter receptor subunit TctC